MVSTANRSQTVELYGEGRTTVLSTDTSFRSGKLDDVYIPLHHHQLRMRAASSSEVGFPTVFTAGREDYGLSGQVKSFKDRVEGKDSSHQLAVE